jgi:glycosyltransferase involved in cell wall biosynthesis
MIQLRKKGHSVYFLSTCEEGDLHQYFRSLGIQSQGLTTGSSFFPIVFLRRFFALLGFCSKHRITIVHSHLHPTNIVAVFAQYWIKSKVFIFRHHLHHPDDSIRLNRNERIFDRIISKFARKIVVPSTGVLNGMVQNEGVPAHKVVVIPYLYDFSRYNKPDPDAVAAIRNQYPCRLLLIMVSRMIKLKRHMVAFQVVRHLVEQGHDIKLLALDDGEERENLERWIRENDMQKHIMLLGFKRDFINYMAASDLLLQPSLTDASNSVAKEMAYLKKVIAVSQGVGDYSDYVVDGFNGFLLPLEDTATKMEEIIRSMYADPHAFQLYGERLYQTVMEKFDVSNSDAVMECYDRLHQS